MLEFQEFVRGLQFCGIAMPLSDYRIVYNLINYDNAPYIDFQKFCLINIDKSNDIKKVIEETKKNKEHQLQHEKEDEHYYNDRFLSSKYPGSGCGVKAAKNKVQDLFDEQVDPSKITNAIHLRHKLINHQQQRRPKPYA